MFPYDPSIPVEHKPSAADIGPRNDLAEHDICETYSCDSDGVITVRLQRRSDGQTRAYEILRELTRVEG